MRSWSEETADHHSDQHFLGSTHCRTPHSSHVEFVLQSDFVLEMTGEKSSHLWFCAIFSME